VTSRPQADINHLDALGKHYEQHETTYVVCSILWYCSSWFSTKGHCLGSPNCSWSSSQRSRHQREGGSQVTGMQETCYHQGEEAEEISYGCQLNLFSHAYHNKPDTFAFEGMLRHKLSMTLKITLERWWRKPSIWSFFGCRGEDTWRHLWQPEGYDFLLLC